VPFQRGISTAFHPDGQPSPLVATTAKSPSGRSTLVETATWSTVAMHPPSDYYSPDGQLLLAAYSDNVARIWRAIRLRAGRHKASCVILILVLMADWWHRQRRQHDPAVDAQTGQQLDISTSTKICSRASSSVRTEIPRRVEVAPTSLTCGRWRESAQRSPSILAGHSDPLHISPLAPTDSTGHS